MPSKGLAEHLAQRVLARLPKEDHPPVDVELVARHLGVDAISRRRMVEDGRLDHGTSRIEISVKENTSLTRQRFTIAHEIGHLLLTEPRQSTLAYRALARVNDIERFCDDFAAALLMPHDWVANRFRTRAKNLSTVRHLAHQASTSLSAAVVRLNRVLDWNYGLVSWARRDGVWRYQFSAGLPAEMHRGLRTTEPTRACLDRLMTSGRADTWTQVMMSANGEEIVFNAHMSVNGQTAIALADLRLHQTDIS